MQINQYLIFKNKLLGRGEYSDVYLCENTLTKNYYAIKIQTKKDIEKEISILKRLHSKYIVAIYEIIQSENESYIIFDLFSLFFISLYNSLSSSYFLLLEYSNKKFLLD